MASKIYEHIKSMNKEMWLPRAHRRAYTSYGQAAVLLPIIAKGNRYQGIEAQW